MVTAITGMKLIDGTGAEPIEDAVVLIEGNLIKAVGRRGEVDVSKKTEVIDVGSATILPGLIDGHEHLGHCPELGPEPLQVLSPDVEIAFRMARNARTNLRCGVTTVRICGDKNSLDLACKKAIEDGFIPGPRVITSGSAFKPTHGSGSVTTAVDGVDAMRAAVRKHFVCGVEHQAVDHIKIFVSGSIATLPLDSEPWRSYFTKEEIFVAAEEAHRMKKPVAAHCHGGEGADWCIEAGIDSIEHGAWLSLLQLEKMAAKGIAWVPTLAIIFKPRPPEHPRIMAKREDAQKRLKENIRKALEMGVKIVAGTDNLHGMLWNELQWMVNFGMPPMAALLTATKGAAELCRKGETIGTIEPGKFADLIAVKDDPLSDISCLKNVIFVMKDGKRYELPE